MASYDDTATVSGSVVGFSNGADSVPLKNWQVTLPASLDGYSEVNGVKIASNNLMSFPEADFTINGIRFYTVNGILYLDGTQTSAISSLNESFKALDFWIPSGTYYFNRGTIALPTFIRTYDDMAEFQVNNGTFTITEPKHLYVSIYMANKVFSNAKADMCVSVGSTSITYEDSKPKESYTASLGRTVYGGTADIVTGEGEDGYAKGSMTSTYLSGLSSSYIGYEASLAYFGGHACVWVRNWNYQTAAARTAGGIGAVCNHFPISFNNSDIFASQYRVYFDVDGKNISSVQDFIDYVSTLEQNNDSLDIVYELATATAFTFTPIIPTPETAKGNNTFWSDQGNTELTYYKDGYGFTSVTIHKETPDGEPVEETRKLHRIIYEGQVDVISGTGLIYRGESGTQYDPPEQISFTPIEIATDEGENTLYADQGDSAITYRKAVE